MRTDSPKPMLTSPHKEELVICKSLISRLRPRTRTCLVAALTLGLAQLPANVSAIAQYGPPASGSSSAILFTPAIVGLVAGLNGSGDTGNGGLATAATLNFPMGVGYDSNGNLYIADSNNYSVRKIDTTGHISTYAGTGSFGTTAPGANVQATSIGLGILTGLAVDSGNNVYFGDRSNMVIWKVNTSGVITVYAGTLGSLGYTGDAGAATAATIDQPYGLAFDAAGDLYFTDYQNNVVRVIGTNGKINTFAGTGTGFGQFSTCPAAYTGNGGLATAAQLCHLQGVAVDSAGNVYISSYTDSQVYIVGTNLKINVFAGNGTAPGSSSATYTGDGGPAASAELWRPMGLYADPAGDIYIVDQFGGEIREVNTAGTISTIYGIGSGSLTHAIIGLSDLEQNSLGIGDANGIFSITMDTFGNLIVPSADAYVVLTAGSTGQYRFPGTPIFTTETTTQANASSAFYPAYVTISNPSGVTLTFTGTPVVTGPFAVVTGTGAGTCTFPGSLVAGKSCTVVMSFTPTLGGSSGTVQTGSIVLTSNANSSPSTISLSGTGTGTATVSATLTPFSLTFTSQAGVTSAAQQSTLTNTGQIPIAVGSTDFDGVSASFFALSGTTCPSGAATLAVGATCTYSITFTPNVATTYSGGFQSCISTASYGCLSNLLLGTGTPGPTATLLPTPLAFGSVVQGQTSAPMSATLTNTGSGTLNIGSFTINGANPADFAITTGTNACGSTLAAGSSCIVYLTFTPAAATSFSAQLSVADNAASSPQTVSLTGTGVAPTVAPSPLIFNPAPVGISLASAQTLTATFQVNGFAAGFTPTAKLHYGLSYSIGAVNCTGTAGSESCSVPVTFQPQYPGGRRDALVLSNGSTTLATVQTYGVGQGPFGLVQPGVVTNPILNGPNTLYASVVGEDGTAYVLGQNSNTVYSVSKAGVVTTLPIVGISSPNSIAVDGAGTLYIAQNTYSKQLITYTAAGVQGTLTVVPPSPYVPCANSNGGTLEYLYAVAVGIAGDIYTTEILCQQVFELKRDGTYATTPISPSITQPFAMIVDSAENDFVGGYQINEITAGGVQSQINTIGEGIGLVVDAADTLYTTRYTGLSGVTEMAASNYSAPLASLDSGAPLGLSVGPDGTIYVGNYSNLDKVDRSQGVIAFGQIGATATQNVSIYNGGNQPLTITNIGITGAGFTFAPAATNPCTLNVAIAPGALCQVAVTLTAPHAGIFAGTLIFTDNSLNSASSTQTIALSGAEYGIYVTASPTSLTFGSETVGLTTAVQTVTLTNNGELYSATIGATSGTAPFNVTQGTCTTALAPGASCVLNVSFSPTSVQTYTNVGVGFGATSSGGGPTQAVTFTVSGIGTAATAPVAGLSPNPLAFPNTTVASTATALPVTLSNTGNATMTGIVFSITGTSPSDFATTSATTCGTTLAAGSTCAIYVSFTPATATSFAATLSVADNATGSPQTVTLTGTGTAVPTPQASLSPNPLAFPSTLVGTAATALPMTLSNAGTAALTITSISVAGTNASSFGQSNNCGASLAAGANCTITVTFTPSAAGSLSASISVVDNATGSPHTAALTGTGTAPQASLAPTSLTFPGTAVGTSAGTQSTTLSNPGTAALTVTGISIAGTNASSFGQSNTCGASLAAGASCVITVTFTPGSAGSLGASLSIGDNATGSPQTVTLTGTGTAPQATLSPNPLAFPSTLVGTAASALPMTLSNPGTAALTITSISVSGTNASSFGQNNNCGASLAAGATCTISVTFTPGSAAALTAAISVVDSASGSPHTAALTGTGTAPLVAQAVLSPNPLTFPSTTINTSATPLPMTLSNPGNAPLTITGISVTGANASSFGETSTCGATLAAGANCTITVTFAPASAATFTAAITVADNAAGSPQSAVISGIGSAGTYVVNASTPTQTVQPGGVAQFNLVVAPLGGSYNNLVTLTATGLPAGATYSFLPAAVTPGIAGAPSVLSIQTSTGLARLKLPEPQRRSSAPLLALLLGVPLLGVAGSLRRFRRSSQRWMLLGLAALAILPILALSGCGGGYFGPAPQTFTINVVGTSGALQESTTISLTVQ
jgi:Abnormal spindle-like microcephaly-assoc'd, ASPM-SPD-2-Hydin/NHL repeat